MSSNKIAAFLGADPRVEGFRNQLRNFDFVRFSQVDALQEGIRKHRFDLLICDIALPEMSGHSALAELRNLAKEVSNVAVPCVWLVEDTETYATAAQYLVKGPLSVLALTDDEIVPLVNLVRTRANESPSRPKKKGVPAILDDHPFIRESTAFLRDRKSGRLDAKKIAAYYGEPLTKFASALGVSSSAVSQTPDSPNYQTLLRPFEQVARIASLLEDGSFSAWAKTPNTELKNASPLECLWGSQDQARRVVRVVDDVLTGQPD